MIIDCSWNSRFNGKVADVPRTVRRRLFGATCYICGKHLSIRKTTYDHVHPRSKGGKGSLNLLPCHEHCNYEKGDKVDEEYTGKARFYQHRLIAYVLAR